MAKKLNINKDAYVSTTGITLEQIAKAIGDIVVVEKGTNSNGSWIKFGNGILIQYGKITGIYIGAGSAGATTDITFPKPYIDSNYNIQTQMTGNPGWWSWVAHTIRDGSKTTTGFTVGWWNNNSVAIDTVGVYWCTFGLWK